MLKAKHSFWILTVVVLASGPAHSFDERIKRELMRLEPTARLEQACDTELMSRINKEHNQFRVDKVIAYTFSDPSYKGDSINAPGASFRSRGDWYHLAYQCRTGPHRLGVKDLSYEVGEKVERQDWKKYSLYN
ncbi:MULTISPECIES: DUF930 domain-containing protein [unclassified Beijerinckia]|uniref:DUF930 domain-containing protein n=1 Tax=unclassified Beijerinckia TaxID=2638183 RepID=UPI001FCD1ABA|nr:MULTISPECIES: DUF930 domain-containing protein [unclassified Beijerinckia]MDH7796156.1 hypothetical protein [Beijerinckia sp. GAS462]